MPIYVGLGMKNSKEAAELYQKAFGLTLGGDTFQNADGSYDHAELFKDGQYFFSIGELKDDGFAKTMLSIEDGQIGMCIQVLLENEDNVRKAFDLLRAGGKVLKPLAPMPWSPLGGDVIDKFGVYWYITAPQHRPPIDWNPEAQWDPSMYKKP